MIFYERLGEIAQKTGKSINQIERELGYPRNSIHNYKYGAEPSASRLMEIANYLQISPEYLIGTTSEKQPINFIVFFDNLDDEYKLKLLELALSWFSSLIKKTNQ